MARELKFNISNTEFSLIPTKIERRKIYGWTETKAFDSNGNLCIQVRLKRDLKVTSNEKQALSFMDQAIEENVKKGWQEAL